MTAGVYGRLSQLDAEGSLRPVGFLADNQAAVGEAKSQWESLARFLQHPYHFAETAGGEERPSKQMRREQLVERAAAAAAAADTAMVGPLQRQMEMLVALRARLDARDREAESRAPGGGEQTHE